MIALKKLITLVDSLTKYSAMAAFTVMSVMIVLQVVFRYVFEASLSYSEELARFLFIWATLLGAAMCVQRRSHVGFDLLMTKLPASVRKYGGLLANLMGIFFYLVIIIYGFKVVGITMGQTSPALGLKMGYVYLSVPVAGIIMLLNGTYNLMEDFTAYTKNTPEKGRCC